jgi:mono/diheme cytochrome c family protein
MLGALNQPTPVAAQGRNPRVSYTSAQADRGEAAYVEHCESCHGRSLDDGPFAPPLKGREFRGKWVVRSMEELFTKGRQSGSSSFRESVVEVWSWLTWVELIGLLDRFSSSLFCASVGWRRQAAPALENAR